MPVPLIDEGEALPFTSVFWDRSFAMDFMCGALAFVVSFSPDCRVNCNLYAIATKAGFCSKILLCS